MNTESLKGLSLVGPFTEAQEGILEEGLQNLGLLVQACSSDLSLLLPQSAIAVRGGVSVPSNVVEQNNIPLVISAGSGTDNIERGNFTVDNCPGLNAPEVAAHAMALLMIALEERIENRGQLAEEILQMRTGIIGAGHIGLNMKFLLRDFGLHADLARSPDNPPIHECGIDNNLSRVISDKQIIIIAAGTPSIITLDNIDLLSQAELVVNVGRGNALPIDAIKYLLANGVSYYTDVWPDEPQKGEPISESIRELIALGARGTMHVAAHQTTSDERIAHALIHKLEYWQQYGTSRPNINSLDRYRKLQHTKPRYNGNALVGLGVHMEESPDVVRVRRLVNHMTRAVNDDNGRWQVDHPNGKNNMNSSYDMVNRLTVAK